jgi:hypothetical protein
MDKEPYIAKLVDFHRTGNGNFFCREEGESENEHPIDWPIFVGIENADKMSDLPIFGIVVTDYNLNFFNGKSRPTCRVLSKDRSYLEKILGEEEELDKLIQNAIEDYKKHMTLTLETLKSILKTKTFVSSVKGKSEHYEFNFTEIYIFRDKKPLGVYELLETKDGFTIVVVQPLQSIFTDNFKNIVLKVPGDSRFPIIINFDSLVLQKGGLEITLEEKS